MVFKQFRTLPRLQRVHTVFLGCFLKSQSSRVNTESSLAPFLFIWKCQLKNAFHVFSKNGNSFYISFIYFILCLNSSLHTLRGRPKRFGWHKKDGYKSRRNIKLSIFKGISNHPHSWQKSRKNIRYALGPWFRKEDMKAQGSDAFCKESTQTFLQYIYKANGIHEWLSLSFFLLIIQWLTICT